MSNKLINVFNNTVEALEEYIEKIGYPGFKKQIFDKSINSPNRSPEDLAEDFLCQLYLLKAMVMINRKKPEFSHQEVQEEFFKWIDAAGIKVNNYSKSLNYYLFTINEVLEGRGENFSRQTEEKNNSGKEPSPKELQELYSKYSQELHNPSEKKEVNIQGNYEIGKEIFKKIVNSLSDSERQNFRFWPINEKEGTKVIDRKETSWPTKVAIGAIILVVPGILILLIVKINKKKKKNDKIKRETPKKFLIKHLS